MRKPDQSQADAPARGVDLPDRAAGKHSETLPAEYRADIVVYGGTSAGVMAAIQAVRMNKTAVIVEPGRRIGGLTTGGLGRTDIGSKAAIGGLAREFYRRVRAFYADASNWRWQKPESYQATGANRAAQSEDCMWTFEPSAAQKIFADFIAETNVPVAYGERLNRAGGVAMDGRRILSIEMESGRKFRAAMFIDASYEGDLMAAAGVACRIGREAESVYGENLNGVRARQAVYHQLRPGVDPYVVRGQPASGLLPGIDPAGPGVEGAGDARLQAYCFRMCLTDHPENRLPFQKPAGYCDLDYELLFRNYEAGETAIPWINTPMPNRKTDTNNRGGVSTDFIGRNFRYPAGTYAERAAIVRAHLKYQQGLMWALANHPRVPAAIRAVVSCWGVCKDEFLENAGWPEQLYIREARRMIGAMVMTQHHCEGRVKAADPVGMAAYGMDSHHVRRYVGADGFVRNEGDVEVGNFAPYPISFQSIVPCAGECVNLAVPVCLSASHIAFGSIRMEPVFMLLGQSAATAAAHAIDEQTAIQHIDYDRLQRRLLADGQILT